MDDAGALALYRARGVSAAAHSHARVLLGSLAPACSGGNALCTISANTSLRSPGRVWSQTGRRTSCRWAWRSATHAVNSTVVDVRLIPGKS